MVPIILVFVVAALGGSLRIAIEYERAIIFRLGRFHRLSGPGVYVAIPLLERARKLDLRTETVDIESQDTVTKDSVTVSVNAVLYYKVENPK